MSPFDDALNPIRLAVMEGRPVIAVESNPAQIEPILVEAARLCGRERDLRILHLAPPGPAGTIHPGSRRMCPEAVPSEAAIAYALSTLALEALSPGAGFGELAQPSYGRDVANARAALAGVPTECADLPPFDPEDARDGRHLVLVRVDRRPVPYHPFFDALAFGAIARAIAEDRPEPLVACETGFETGLRKILTWSSLLAGPSIRVALVGESGFMRRAQAPDLVDAFRWRALASGGPSPEIGDGYALLRDADRLVVARHGVPSPQDGGRRPIDVIEVLGGHCAGTCFTPAPEAGDLPMILSALCRLVWRGGLQAVRGPDAYLGGSGEAPLAAPARNLLRPPPEYGYPEVGPLVGDRLDAPLALAVDHVARAASVTLRVGADPGRRDRRRDFVLTFPALCELILEPDLCDRVDAGAEAIPLVARRLGTTPAIVRRLVGVPRLPRTARPPLDRMDGERIAIADYLGAFGHDRLPPRGEAGEWDAFLECADVAHRTFLRIAAPPAALVAELMTATPGRDWRERLARIDACPGHPDDVADVARALAPVLRQLGVDKPSYLKAYGLLARHGSLPRLLRASADWHDNPVLSRAGSALPPDAAWPVPFAPVDLGDGWSARAIASLAGLVDEGRHGDDADGIPGLAHCVATYGPPCAEGGSVVLSIARAGPEGLRRVSTAELRRTIGGDWRIGAAAFSLVQHRAFRNARPPAAAAARLRDLQLALSRGEVPIDADALRPRTVETVERADATPAEILVDWEMVLPPCLRGLDPEAFRKAAERLSDPAGDRARPRATGTR